MKRIILFLILITQFAFAQVNTTTTTVGKLKMNIPDPGAKKDSVVVWDGTTKLLKFRPASQITGTTNLDQLVSPTGISIFSSTGTDVVLPLATGTNAGLFAPEEKTKLAGIASGATANDTDANLKNRANHTGTQAIATVTGLQTALDGKEPIITAGTTSQYYRGDKTFQTLDKTAVGLGNVDNTTDLLKPISTANQTALNLKANLASPALTGTPTAPTATAGTNTTQVATTAFVKSEINFVTPEQFGAVGNGVTDDKTAIQNAINSGKMVLLNGNYFTSGTITISNKTTIYGNGNIKTTSNLPILDIKASDVVIDGIRLEGSGRGTSTDYATTRPLQDGINIFGDALLVNFWKNIRISNVYGYNLGGSLINVEKNGGAPTVHTGGASIVNTTAELCWAGYTFRDRAEYNTSANIKSIKCEYGAYILSANNSITAVSFEDNRTGVFVGTSSNTGHTNIVGGTINHSILKSVDVLNQSDGYVFSDLQILYGDISIVGSDQIQFFNTNFYSPNITVTTSTNTQFKNCKWNITPTTFTGLSTVLFFGNKWLGTPPTGYFESIEGATRIVGGVGGNLGIDRISGQSKSVSFYTSGSPRWDIQSDNSSESSTAIGSDFKLVSFNNNGSVRAVNLEVNRNTGATAFSGTISASPATLSNQVVVKSQLDAAARPYKVYTALLTQTGTNAPVATILENTLGVTITWYRDSAGTYSALRSSGSYTGNKTFGLATLGGSSGISPTIEVEKHFSTNAITVYTKINGNLTDGVMTSQATIEIRVYN
jgi:hypothetical protein